MRKQLEVKLKDASMPDFSSGLRLYKIMRIKMKISYSAWRKNMSVNELIYQTIMDSFKQLRPNKKTQELCFEQVYNRPNYLERLREIVYPKPYNKELNKKQHYDNPNLEAFLQKIGVRKKFCTISFVMFMQQFGLKCKNNPL